ncbi:MAG: NUDIX domain-containing protein [Bacteroidales bacterium]|nr:NUDIX domain-containing protein [Bacteroidales bacterium]
MKSKIFQYNVRVYGIILNNNAVLLTDEFRHNLRMTKFPGGGLQFGEGPVECIMREAVEEFGQEVEVIEHFYTTHFFQPDFLMMNGNSSAFTTSSGLKEKSCSEYPKNLLIIFLNPKEARVSDGKN